MLLMLGIGAGRIIKTGGKTSGKVTKVSTCWWPKINTKPVRKHMWDGAVYPHIIDFAYTVNGKEYTGRRYVSWEKTCPQMNETIQVYYDREDPAKYAVSIQ